MTIFFYFLGSILIYSRLQNGLVSKGTPFVGVLKPYLLSKQPLTFLHIRYLETEYRIAGLYPTWHAKLSAPVLPDAEMRRRPAY